MPTVRAQFAQQRVSGHEVVGRAPSPSLLLFENTFGDQILDIPQGCIVRTLCEFRPLLGCQFPLKAVEQQIDYLLRPVADYD